MKIHHYTTLETLALILKNKTIRFNRLDQMDDPCERNIFSTGMDWSKCTFVSCWTEDAEEKIPLWEMYASGKGVRISIDKDFIDWENTEAFNVGPNGGKHIPPSSPKELGAIEVPLFGYEIYGKLNNQICYHKMKYISEKEELDLHIRIGANQTLIQKTLTQFDFEEFVGLYKTEHWKFQDETRFRIFAFPCYETIKEEKSFESMVNEIQQHGNNNFRYIDVPIKPKALDELEIMLSPNASQGHAEILNALKEVYPNIQLRNSRLNSDQWGWLT